MAQGFLVKELLRMSKRKNKFNKKMLFGENIKEKLAEVSKNLVYISETDAPFEAVLWIKSDDKPLNNEAVTILQLIEHKPETAVREQTIDFFFQHPTKIEDWFGEEEIKTAENFLNLKKTLEENLKDIKVYKIGEIKIDVLIIGLDEKGNLAGVRTKGVET
jgi:hypothetical protein